MELYIIYISEFDFLKGGLAIYHIDKIIRENGAIVDDGLHEIFVNTTVNDGTAIADLMSCFIKKEFKNDNFPKLSQKVKELKSTEGGANTMSAISETIYAEGKAEGLAEGKAEGLAKGKAEGRMNQLIELVQSGLLTVNQAASVAKMSEEEFKKLMEK